MRGRYLCTDHFFHWSKTKVFPSLLRLPPPNILPDPSSSPSSPDLFAFDADLDLSISLDLDAFPIDVALSRFLSDVVPKPCCYPEESNGFVYEDNGTGTGWIPEGNGSSGECGIRGNVDLFQFEILEVDLDFPLIDNRSYIEIEGDAIGLGIRGTCISQDTISTEPGGEIPYPCELMKLLLSVEDIPINFNLEKGSCCSGAVASLPDGNALHSNKLPLFEVSEIGLDLGTNLSTKEAFHFLLPDIRNCYTIETDDIVISSKEFVPRNVSDLEDLPEPASSFDCLELKSICFDNILEMDLINLKNNLLVEKDSAIYPVAPIEDSSQKPCSVHFQEVQILDMPLQSFEMFGSPQVENEQEMPEQIFRDDMIHVVEFYESLISSELNLIDDTFKSLPVPVLFNEKEKISSSIIIETVLYDLSPYPMSACDGIYLDWHLLLGNPCGHEICYTHMDILTSVSTCNIAWDMQNCAKETAFIDFHLWEEDQAGSCESQEKEVPVELPAAYKVTSLLATATPTQILEDEIEGSENRQELPKISRKRVSSLFESMSQCNDLNYFLNVRRGSSIRNNEDEIKEKAGDKTSASYPEDPCVSSEVDFQQWNVKSHLIILSDEIHFLVDAIYKCYLSILQSDTALRHKICSVPARNDFQLLGLSKEKLMELITENFLNKPQSSCKDDAVMTFVALYAIRQLAYFLCFFGIQSAYIYVSRLCQGTEYLRVRLGPVTSLLEEAQWKVKKEVVDSHPSLSVIAEILRSNSCRNVKKTLIVAERVFWLPLKQKLSSMKIPLYELVPNNTILNHQNVTDCNELRNSIVDALQQSDCFLVSYEHVFASFPFSNFSIILEYGGRPHGSSIVSTISPTIAGSLLLYFINVKLDDYSVARSLCEGFDICQHREPNVGTPQSMHTLKGNTDTQNIVELLNFVPTEEKTSYMAFSESDARVETACEIETSLSTLNLEGTKNVDSGMAPFPNTVIIVNTQTSEKEMLMSRRSSYQKILAMEKGGLQVVERDTSLPLDIIFSAATCLVWYDARNIGKNTDGIEENSCISKFMEVVATNVLMALSCAFNSCLLVFEGESDFLAAVMESSDALYAAAASLGIHLQLFCSYSPELTDETILSCIKHATKFCGGLYPAMLESESLAESFLTKFPSVNPLSAHAILSSGGKLVEFLEWPHQHRIQVIREYHVPDESMSLFSTLCRYGELGESKSGMTECSSIDSDMNSSRRRSLSKRQKCTFNSHPVDLQMDDLSFVGPIDKENTGNIEPSKAFQPCHSRDLFDIQDVVERQKKSNFPVNNDILGEKWMVNLSEVDNLGFNTHPGHVYLRDDFDDEVIDRNCVADKNLAPTPGSIKFSRKSEIGRERLRNSCTADRFPLDFRSHPVFPTSAEINHNIDEWSSLKNYKKNTEDKICESLVSGAKQNALEKKRKGESSGEKNIQRARNILGSSNRGKVAERHGESLFSNNIRSSILQKGSPWTVEFYNNVNDKSTKPQQHLTCNTCLNCPGSLGNKDKISKSLSPSIIDSFRYQGGSQPKPTRKNWQKPARRPVDSFKEDKRVSSSIAPTWTPVDKRAKQNLSFIRNGNEKQSKLVWRNMSIPGTNYSSRKRYIEET